MEIGQLLETTIISRTEHGEGISHHQGKLLIIPGANIDQRVRVKIVEKGETRVICEVIDFLN